MTKAFIVLGTPRSGTSLVAGMLHNGGTRMGYLLNRPQPANPAGFFEDMEFIWINQAILESVGCAWNLPPSDEKMAELGQSNAADVVRTLVGDKQSNAEEQGWDAWGFKDHRAYLLLPLYAPVLAELDCHFVYIHRNPLAVALSFVRAWPDLFPNVARALVVIGVYQLRIASFLMAHEWQVTHTTFESLTDTPDESVATLAEALGVDLARDHLDPGLRHF